MSPHGNMLLLGVSEDTDPLSLTRTRGELGQRASVRCVAAALIDGTPVGMLTEEITLAHDDEALLLIALASSAPPHALLCNARHLGITVTRPDSGLAKAFAHGGTRFSTMPWREGTLGQPLLRDGSACFEVEITGRVTAGGQSLLSARACRPREEIMAFLKRSDLV